MFLTTSFPVGDLLCCMQSLSVFSFSVFYLKYSEIHLRGCLQGQVFGFQERRVWKSLSFGSVLSLSD